MGIPTFAETIAQYEYPGRIVLLGRDGRFDVAVYCVTARSASSRAKVYAYDRTASKIAVVATDPEVMSQGNLDLLDYTACHFGDGFLVIGNGSQTDAAAADAGMDGAGAKLRRSLSAVSYEPDKYRIPRITGCISWAEGNETAAIHSVRSDAQGSAVRDGYDIPLESGRGFFVRTYAGPNVRPTPSFEGGPVEVSLDFGSASECARQIYGSLAPADGGEDLRVSVVAVYREIGTGERLVSILNQEEIGA